MTHDIRNAIAEFDNNAEQINRSFIDSLAGRGTPPVIYHYTDDTGLRGILESGKLRLSNVFNLNDPSELRHGFSQAVAMLKEKAAGHSPVAKELAGIIEDFYQDGKVQESAHFFTCSFSSDGDDLGQWRAYADNGRGYVLGFYTKALESAFIQKGNSPFAQTFPLTYGDVEMARVQDQIIGEALSLTDLPAVGSLQAPMIDAFKLKLVVSLTVHTLHSAMFFKHEAYRNEREYRFLEMFPANVSPSEVKVRTRPYSLVRYREFDWRGGAPLALTGIVVGPAADEDKAPQFARDCLHLFHDDAVDVTKSAIPYRAL
jgi:hypothetical protein